MKTLSQRMMLVRSNRTTALNNASMWKKKSMDTTISIAQKNIFMKRESNEWSEFEEHCATLHDLKIKKEINKIEKVRTDLDATFFLE